MFWSDIICPLKRSEIAAVKRDLSEESKRLCAMVVVKLAASSGVNELRPPICKAKVLAMLALMTFTPSAFPAAACASRNVLKDTTCEMTFDAMNAFADTGA